MIGMICEIAILAETYAYITGALLDTKGGSLQGKLD
jgi:hypothetical protein